MVTRSDAAGVRIFLLGGFRVFVGPHQIADDAWRLRKARSLIKLLSLAPCHRLHREQVTNTLWPDLAPEAALNNLHQTMHIARRAFAPALASMNGTNQASNGDLPALLRIHGHIVTLEPLVWVDVEAFEQAAAQASATPDIAAHETARLLYTAELLPDDRYEEWTLQRRESLAGRHLALLLAIARLSEQAGDLPRAIENLQRVVATDLAHEDAHAGLMRLYALMGQRQTALRQFQTLQTALKEIDASPQPASVNLQQAILSDDLATLTSPSPPHSRGSERRHKAPLRGVEAAKRHPAGSLPVPLASFVGRERDLASVRDALRETRLLTLTGPGGIGKSRLGLEFAGAARDRFPDGVWWVDLQALRHAHEVAQTVATTMRIREQPGQSLQSALADWIHDKRILLVLDNCEHLLAGSAALVEGLLGTCPHLRVLTTSRERLSVPGEVRWVVQPLALPERDGDVPPEELRTFEAVRLFETRSRAVNSGFVVTATNAATVAEICRRLDGLPLAIELAAARTHILSPAEMLKRLSDRLALPLALERPTARYRSLADVIDWSYRLLNETERLFLTRLVVFAGGFTLEAAQGICAGPPLQADRTLDLLVSLVEKSLVVVEEPSDGSICYRLLETIREHAQGKLASSAQLRDRHLSWFIEFIAPLGDFEAIDAGSHPYQTTVRRAVAREIDNLRAAVEWAHTKASADGCLRLTYGLGFFWFGGGLLREGRDRIRAALEHPDRGSPLLRAKAVRLVGRLNWTLGENEAATRFLEDALVAFRALGDRYEIARSLMYLGSLARTQGDYAKTITLYQESLAIFRELDAKPALASLLGAFGQTQLLLGNYQAGESSARQGVAFARTVGIPWLLADSLEAMGLMHQWLGNFAAARACFEESLDLARQIDHPITTAGALNGLAVIARNDGDLAKARALSEQALQFYQAVGFRRGVVGVLRGLGAIARAQNQLDEAGLLLESGLREAQAIGDKFGITLILLELAYLACQRRQGRRAALLLGAAEAMREALGATLRPASRGEYEQAVLAMRRDLGVDECAQAWAEGRRMMADDAVGYALNSGMDTGTTGVAPQLRTSQRGALA